MTSGLDGLSDRQRLLLERWLPSAHVVADHSWGLVETTVLEVTHEGPRLIVKAGSEDDHHIERELPKTLAWLSGPHGIAAPTAERLRAQIGADELVRIIDFGRAAMRAPLTDFGRLAAQDFRRDPRLEAAFLAGYGSDPRDHEAWYRSRVREAIGTAGWAYQVGDEQFEAQGHRMIADVLSGA